MTKVRIIFIDDHPQQVLYDFHIIENGKWISAYDSGTNFLTYIPSSRIHSITDLGSDSKDKK